MLVSTISMLLTEDSEETILVSFKELEQVTCIQYLIVFPGDETQDGLILDPMLSLFNSDSKVNAMHPALAEKLGLVMQTTNVGA